MAEVVYKVGFKDPNYFSRSFKDKYDVSPSEFRESASPAAAESDLIGVIEKKQSFISLAGNSGE